MLFICKIWVSHVANISLKKQKATKIGKQTTSSAESLNTGNPFYFNFADAKALAQSIPQPVTLKLIETSDTDTDTSLPKVMRGRKWPCETGPPPLIIYPPQRLSPMQSTPRAFVTDPFYLLITTGINYKNRPFVLPMRYERIYGIAGSL